jgi:hypothetical protein
MSKSSIPTEEEWRQLVANRLHLARKDLFHGLREAAIALYPAHNPPVKSRIGMWETGARVPVTYTFFEISQQYKKHPAYLAGLTDDLIYPTGLKHSYELLGLHRSLLDDRMINSEHLVTTRMPDQGLKGDIEEGEVIVIDISEQDISPDKIYAIDNNGALLVRRITHTDDEHLLKITSNNQTGFYPDITLLADDLYPKIIGRVINALRNF